MGRARTILLRTDGFSLCTLRRRDIGTRRHPVFVGPRKRRYVNETDNRCAVIVAVGVGRRMTFSKTVDDRRRR